jgi:hypothetical protein
MNVSTSIYKVSFKKQSERIISLKNEKWCPLIELFANFATIKMMLKSLILELNSKMKKLFMIHQISLFFPNQV